MIVYKRRTVLPQTSGYDKSSITNAHYIIPLLRVVGRADSILERNDCSLQHQCHGEFRNPHVRTV